MFKKFIHIGNKSLRIALDTAAIGIFLLVLCAAGLLWRVHSGPLSIGFAKDYIESALSNPAADFYVRFDDIVFSWPELSGRFQLDVSGFRVQKGQGEATALTVDQASIALSHRALFFGMIRPVSVSIKAPAVELVRAPDGTIDLFVQNSRLADFETQDGDEEESVSAGEQVADFFRDMATRQRGRGTFFSRLRSFEIEDASVAVRDHQYGLSWYLSDLDFSVRQHRQGVAASFIVELPGGRDVSASAAIDLVYRRASDDFRAAAHIQNINPHFISRFLNVPEALTGQDLFFSGELDVTMDKAMALTYGRLEGSIPDGRIFMPSEYDEPIELRNIAVAATYDSAQETIVVDRLDGSIGNIAFNGTGKGTIKENIFSLPVALRVEEVSNADIAALFPRSEHDSAAYEWLGNRLSGGMFSDVDLKIVLTGEKVAAEQERHDRWDLDVPQLEAAFAFEDFEVAYSDGLMPATHARGRGTFNMAEEVLMVEGESARLGDIEGRDVTVRVVDLMRIGAGHAYITAQVSGPLSTALRYIASEPIGMDEAVIGIDHQKVSGTADLNVEVSLPTIKDLPKEAVDVTVTGTLRDISIPGIVDGLGLSGGPLELATEPGGFRIKGDALLEGRATQMEWHQYFDSAGRDYSMQVKAAIGADRQLRHHFGVELDDYISGTLPVDVTYRLKDGNATVDVRADLSPIQITIDPFHYRKPVGTAGNLRLQAVLVDDVLKEVRDLHIATEGFSVREGEIGFAPMNGRNADIQRGTIPEAKIGDTVMAVDFKVDAQNVMHVSAQGPVLDARPFFDETEKSQQFANLPVVKEKVQPMVIEARATRMVGKNDQSASQAYINVHFDDEGDIIQLAHNAVLGDAGQLSVRFMPDETGKRAFHLQTNDAGRFLLFSDLYENVIGGDLLIYGEPRAGQLRGDLFGAMRMENFRVARAPALAQLLSLMSLTGVTQLLGNEGLVFSKLESEFEWRFRPDGNLLIIKDGKTSGSSIGLTFEGVVNRGTYETDISGTIIPMTEINAVLSRIPLLGNILGGDTGLIAATYSMKGPSSEPRVTINPLSVLAPGFLRNILFEGGYQSKIPGDTLQPGQEPAAAQRDQQQQPQQPQGTAPRPAQPSDPASSVVNP